MTVHPSVFSSRPIHPQQAHLLVEHQPVLLQMLPQIERLLMMLGFAKFQEIALKIFSFQLQVQVQVRMKQGFQVVAEDSRQWQ
jgi:hypothetical protein